MTHPLASRLLPHVTRRILRVPPTRNHHVCVIGSGPAGFYVAQHLVKLRSAASTPLHLDIFEKLPVPFGLVRYGVAPDHPEVKNVTNTFNAVLKNPAVRFVGNIEAGTHVTLDKLRRSYDAIILCHGATSDRLLNIKNEHLITSARDFVGWYNGLPSNSRMSFNLPTAKTALIIGHGNVALDIARILLTPPSALENTDIAPYALKQLQTSSISSVIIVGRRDLLQVSFTIKEFREMLNIPQVGYDIQTSPTQQIDTSSLPRPRKRLTDLIIKSSSNKIDSAIHKKSWTLKFLRSPVEIRQENNRLNVHFKVNKLVNDEAVPTDVEEVIPCDIAFRSIGYKGRKLFPDIPFDERTGVIPNENGRVMDGIYTSGWAGQGPRGVILSTMQYAFEVAKLVSSDLDNLASSSPQKPGFSGLGITHRVTNYDDYLKIAIHEQETGNKITSVDEMMRVCNSS